jgi:hypothetical protein
MSISNPAKWFSGGGSHEHEKEFTFEPGSTLYHFCPSDCGIPGFERHMICNVVLFANDEQHALKIIEDMLNFCLECNREQNLKYYKKHPETVEVREHANSRAKYAYQILQHKHMWKVTLAPTNQFYKVGWASNDTIF